MPSEPSFGQLEAAAVPEAPTSETPFRIALLADFGAAGRTDDLTQRKPRPLDPEDFDTALGALKPAVTLDGLDGGDVEIAFTSLDDFHPDALYGSVDRISDLDGDKRTAYVKALLRHPRFQTVEAAWRGADFLLRRAIKGDAPVQIVLYDVTRDEFAAALNAGDDLAESPLYKLLIEQATQGPKGKPWSLLVGDYVWDANADSAQALGRMAKIAREAAAPFLTGVAATVADKGFAPNDDDTSAWQALRKLPEAALLGAVLPRFLLRLPYGENTKEVEKFRFEEFESPADRVGYLWGNGALAAAALVAQTFVKDSWKMKPGTLLDLGDMTLHSWRDEDDDDQMTVVESWLDAKASMRALGLGIMPLMGVKGKNAVQLTRLAAAALPAKDQPPPELCGRWTQAKGKVALPVSGKPSIGVKVGIEAPPEPSPAAAAPVEDETPPAADEAAADVSAETEELDPELAALLGELNTDTAAEETSAPAAAEPEEAMSDLDPELAALLGDLESDTAPQEETPAAAPEALAEDPNADLDPELAALLGELDSDKSEEAPTPEPEPEEELDPELAALLKEMEV